MVSVSNLTKIFPGKRPWFSTARNDFVAIDTISFTIQAGEVVGLLGPNGAGKTTTMQMLLGILTPTSGSISYFGKDLFKHRKEILKDVAFGSAYTDMPKRLTVQESLTIFGRLYGIYGSELKQRIEKYLALFGMEEFAHRETGTLSAGQKTRAMLAKSFLVQPKIILLDEPTSSLDPDIAHDVRALIKNQQRELGLTVLLASHNMDEVAAICSRVIVLSRGEIIDDNTPERLARSVASARVHLIITDGLNRLMHYLNNNNIRYTVNDTMVEFNCDEHIIADLFIELATLKVRYSSISLEKPTLENYFLEIARLSRGHRHA